MTLIGRAPGPACGGQEVPSRVGPTLIELPPTEMEVSPAALFQQ